MLKLSIPLLTLAAIAACLWLATRGFEETQMTSVAVPPDFVASDGPIEAGALRSEASTENGDLGADLSGEDAPEAQPVGLESEERDIAWASRMEAELYAALAEVENLAAGSLMAECRSTSCRVTLLYPATSDAESLRAMVYGNRKALTDALCSVENLACDGMSTTIEDGVPTQVFNLMAS